MMYNNKLVAAIKVNGKVLREFKESVRMPFGAEYCIYLKNLNTVKAMVYITIDGKDVMKGGLVLNAGQEIDLQRSIVDGNFERGNAFKFIERTAVVEKAKGIGTEDGVIRISYQFAKPISDFDKYHGYIATAATTTWSKLPDWYTTCADARSAPINTLLQNQNFGAVMGKYTGTAGAAGSTNFLNQVGANVIITSMSTTAPAQNEAGITVPGSVNEQKFVYAADFVTEIEKHVIIFHLTGEIEGQQVVAPVTVKAKQKCVTCETVNKMNAKFCKECGTSLQIV